MIDEFINKLIVTCKKPKKQAKIICKVLRRIFLPNVTFKLKDKSVGLKKLKSIGDEYKMSHYIVVGDRYIKIGHRPNGPTATYRIINFKDTIKKHNNSIYNEDPLITISGESNLSDMFIKLSHPGKLPTRNIHFHFNNDEVEIRHYKIETKEEDNVKVGLNEIGPKLTLKLLKIQDSFFPDN